MPTHPARTAPEARAALGRALVALGGASVALGLLPLGSALHSAAWVWAGPDGAENPPQVTFALQPTSTWDGKATGAVGSSTGGVSAPLTATSPRRNHQAAAGMVCGALAAALLPHYGPLLLNHCMDTLAQPGPVGAHLATLLMLQATFSQLQQRPPAGEGE